MTISNDLIPLIEDCGEPAQDADFDAWHILVVDDDREVHAATDFVLNAVRIFGRPLRISHAFSGQEACDFLTADRSVAVVLLDVVMETENAGLRVVGFIRDTLKLNECRIILRTGQPGYAPQLSVFNDYDINDYRTKAELTRTQLITAITAAIRSYEQIRALAENRRGLASAHSALAQILDNTPVPTFVLDANHCVTHWNRACEAATGIPSSGLIGTNRQWFPFYPEERPVLADLIITNDLARIHALYQGKGRPSPIVPGAFEVEDFLPSLQRWLFFTAAAIHDENGRVIGAIETLQDVTARKQAELALIEATAEAEAAARIKAEFLANMSHEIRTPLNAIIGLAHLILKSELSVKQHDQVSRLKSAGDMLLQLINDILDFSKIESERMPIEQVPFVLDEVLDGLSAIVANRAREKGLELHFVVGSDVPQHLIGDPLRLTQVLVNLVGNALKFTEAGQVLVSIWTAERGIDKIRLEVAVQDTGIGISSEQQTRLFRAFSQADASTTRKYGGTGLGLTICHRLVELMGGRISLSSEEGAGSTFLFDVLLGIDAEPEAEAAPHASQRVLVVDDNDIARTVLSRQLLRLGYQADVADSGEAALAYVAVSGSSPYDLIFLDWKMFGMNGVDVARRILSEVTPAPKIIVVTQSTRSEVEEAFAGLAICGILQKPFLSGELAAALKALTTPVAEFRPPKAAEKSEPRLSGLRVLVVDDISINRMIVGELLADEGALIEEAENGREAVDTVFSGGPFDVVLMDIQMPEMNGMDATQQIHADPRFANLPIIAMTAFALEEERQHCLDAGMNGFLTKPIDPETVIGALIGIGNGAVQQRTPAALSPSVPAASVTSPIAENFPSLPAIDTVEGLQRMMNKPAFYERMLKNFHDRFASAPETIASLIAAGRYDDARREAHSVKGVAASVSANGLRAAALALERALANGRTELGDEIEVFSSALQEVMLGLRNHFGWKMPE